ncbi:MAG: deoxyguanosinetriphosphate triphosphohydrolase, partial [Methylophilaceae bacterium]
LRVVDLLEQRYADFDGLNLTFEMREGILKHCSLNNAKQLGDVGERFILKQQPSLEAQVTNLADEIAYNNHDVDDGLRSGLITLEQLKQVSLFGDNLAQVQKRYPDLQGRRLIHETVRRMINAQIVDLCQQSQANIDRVGPQNIDEVRQQGRLIGFSPAMAEQQIELKRFLHKNLYQHYRVNRMSAKAKRIVRSLFEAFIQEPDLMPNEYQDRAKQDQTHALARAVADYVAGMTDRYAIREYQRLFTVEEREL